MAQSTASRNGSGTVGDDVKKAVIRAAAASRKTWYEWIGAFSDVVRPVSVVLVLSMCLNMWQYYQNTKLADKIGKVVPIVAVVDPTTQRVIKTISVEAKDYTVDQAAERKFVKDWIKAFFSVRAEPRFAKQMKGWTRSHVIDGSAALTKVDAYYALNDPLVLGATETVDVPRVDVSPTLSQHTYRVSFILQPYNGSDAMPARTYSGEISLEVILPKNADETQTEYPYTYVKDFTWGAQ